MPFCLNPACPKPDNPDKNKFCHGCGSKLIESTHSYNFEHYHIIKLLGEGGFGRTYLAEDVDLFNQKIVIKKLLSNEGYNPKVLELFQREAQQLYNLNHPQIPKIYRYFSKNNSFFLIQEFIDGENLLTEFEHKGRFNETKIREILDNLLPILEYIQSKDLLHRDIKPENIMRRRSDNKLILIDFGAVRVTSGKDPSVLTSIYSPGYASREQINGRAVKASDVYSLGVTCIRLLTGCLPTGTTDLIYDDYENKWSWKEYLKKQKITVEPKLAQVLDKMIEDALKRRYKEAKEVRQDLLSLTQPTVKPPITPVQPPPTVIVTSPSLTTVNQTLTSGMDVVNFKAITINSFGKVIKQEPKTARYQTLDLGNDITLDLIYIPWGSFMMGSPTSEKGRDDSEGPQHGVDVLPFWMGKYPITQLQWRTVMGNNPSRFKGLFNKTKGDNRPVENVTYYDCLAFCELLSQKLGKKITLPSEAQWEYACRGGTTTPFYCGETITTELANYNGYNIYANEPKGVYKQETTEVGSFCSNPLGLYDMLGNVWEWCLDSWYDDYLGAAGDDKPRIDPKDDYYVLRGGSCFSAPNNCRCAKRYKSAANVSNSRGGFRVVLNI